MGLRDKINIIIRRPVLDMEPADILKIIDPSLQLQEELFGSTKVLLVESEQHGLAVLKIGGYNFKVAEQHHSWKKDHIQNEKNALEHLAGIRGVPQLYMCYENTTKSKPGCYIAILKQYIEGKPASFLEEEGLEFQINMERLIREVTSKGVILEMGPGEYRSTNLIIDEKHQPWLTDLGLSRIIQKKPAKNKTELCDQYNQFRRVYFRNLK